MHCLRSEPSSFHRARFTCDPYEGLRISPGRFQVPKLTEEQKLEYAIGPKEARGKLFKELDATREEAISMKEALAWASVGIGALPHCTLLVRCSILAG